MIRFFGNQNSQQLDATEARLRSLEWKTNAILVIVAIQLLTSLASLARDLFMPSTTTIVIGSAILVAAIWFFRKQIPGLVKRMLVRQIVGDDLPAKDMTASEQE